MPAASPPKLRFRPSPSHFGIQLKTSTGGRARQPPHRCHARVAVREQVSAQDGVIEPLPGLWRPRRAVQIDKTPKKESGPGNRGLLLDLLADAREVARPAAEAPSDRSQASFTAATPRPFPKSGAPFICWTRWMVSGVSWKPCSGSSHTLPSSTGRHPRAAVITVPRLAVLESPSTRRP
jgi:hypothetical protein